MLSLPKLSKELVTSSITFIASLYFTVYCQKYSSKKKNSNIPLPDILHIDSLNLSNIYRITDIPINVYIILLLFKYNKHGPKFLWLISATYFLRALSFSMTTLPKCHNINDKDDTKSCFSILKDYITLKDTHIGHNNDLLPSGHVSFATIFILYLQNYERVNNRIATIIWITNILNSILIILSRCHYSIDVFYAYILSYTVYNSMKYII